MIANDYTCCEKGTETDDGRSQEKEKVKSYCDIGTNGTPLTVLSLNMEFYQQYEKATDKESYEQYLKGKVSTVDVLCVQEDLWSWSDIFLQSNRPFDAFSRLVSSFDEQAAFDDIVRNNNKSFSHYDESFTSTLGNSIYVKKELLLLDNPNAVGWTVADRKVVRISSNLVLPNGTMLGYRSVVCATLERHCHHRPDGPLKDDPRFQKYYNMLTLGIHKGAAKNAMTLDRLDPRYVLFFQLYFSCSFTRYRISDFIS